MKRVFIIGNYDERLFASFVDDVLIHFNFKEVVYLKETIQNNSGGLLFKFKDRILADNP